MKKYDLTNFEEAKLILYVGSLLFLLIGLCICIFKTNFNINFLGGFTIITVALAEIWTISTMEEFKNGQQRKISRSSKNSKRIKN